MGKELFSFSKLNAFHQCEYQYYLNYVLKDVDKKQNVYGYMGNVLHDLCENMSKGKITLDKAKEIWSTECDYSEIMGMKFPTEKSEKSYKNCVSHYLETFTPLEGNNVQAEEYFVLDIEDIQMRGYIDWHNVDHENKTIQLIDYKTSSKFSKKDLESDKVFQLILYGIYLEHKYPDYTVDFVAFDMCKYAKNKNNNKIKLRDELSFMDDEDYTRWLLEVKFNDEMKEKLITFIKETVEEINSKNKKDESQWTSSDNKFYCKNLCSFGDNCKYNK